jgi:hypothetical protein
MPALVPVTLLYGSLCGLLLIGLSTYVSFVRGRFHAGVGQMPPEIVRPVRAHGNASENIPLALILLAALELCGVPSFWMHVLGGTFVFARCLHAFGFLAKNKASVFATTLNHLVILGMSTLGIVWHFLH